MTVELGLLWLSLGFVLGTIAALFSVGPVVALLDTIARQLHAIVLVRKRRLDGLEERTTRVEQRLAALKSRLESQP